jgi:hypothetical protein
LAEGEGPANYVAGWNMPGYLPETEPEFFADFDDAKRYLLNAMGDHADEYGTAGDEDTAEDIETARQDCNLESGPFSVCVADLAYWVETV